MDAAAGANRNRTAMSTTDKQPPAAPPAPPRPSPWPVLLKKLAIWALFLALLYLARDFFFTAFMTFMFSYLTLALVGMGMRRLSPDRERPGLRRLLTVAVFVLVPLAVLGIGLLVGPPLIAQGQRLAGWLSQVSPESEIAHLLRDVVGPAEFRQHYGGPGDPRYQKGLERFRKTGDRHVAAYNDFPKVEAWVEGAFSRQFTESERGRIRSRLLAEGTSSKEFEQWFLTEKFPELQEQARKQVPAKGRAPASVDPLVRAAASAKPEEVLHQVRHDPPALAALEQEWITDTLQRRLAAIKGSTAYHEQFHTYYEQRRQEAPEGIPYTYEEYTELQKVRPEGRQAFGAALAKMRPTLEGESEAQLRADFEAAKQQELFQSWWGASSFAKFVRQQVESGTAAGGSERMERVITSLLNVPVDLSTALLLSLFICIDFPNLRRAMSRLRETWLRDVYDEMAPALTNLATLIGRAMHAQGMIALCNAILLFFCLTFLGVEHAVLLSVAVFVFCLVPTLGTIIAWVLLAAVALVQPGGGLVLALKVSGAVLFVVLMETFVFSPRILGRMMELHPVLIIALLPLAQYFFGVWGLILATPVAVYVIHVLILQQGLPGIESPHEPASGGRKAEAAPEAPAPEVSSERKVDVEVEPGVK
jgi:predicted PurR-regulated permease PerM